MIVLAKESRNLPTVLQMAEAVYRGSAGQLGPIGRDILAQRARHIAASVQFGLDEPGAMRRLSGLSGDLHNAAGLGSLLPRVLDGAVALMEADFGTLQLLDPVTGSLWLVTQSGFGPEFLRHFVMVDDRHSASGRAAQAFAQTVIADVNADTDFAPHRGIAAAAGVRAVQSTPLADYSGRLMGVVSTHFGRPYRPPARELRIMELFGDVAGEAIAQRLGVPAGDGLGNPVGRAVLAALLGPGEARAPDLAIVSGPADAPGARLGHPPLPTGSLEDVTSQLLGEVVHRLFSVGLSLDSARSMIPNSAARDRVDPATDQVDRIIRDIRTIMFSLAVDAESSSPERWPVPPGPQGERTAELLDWVTNRVFSAGLALHSGGELPGGTAEPQIAEALLHLDEAARAIRDHVFADGARPGHARISAPQSQERPAGPVDRAALRQRMARTARALQVSAADAAALLEQQADLAGQPQRLDYPTEIKRWRAFADQAGQMAKLWEQPPHD